MKRIFSLLLVLGIAPVLAQEGPGYPCQGCLEDQPAFDQPTSALWYAVDQPGTGLSLTVQDGFAVGVYYGFTDAGKPLWYLFTGMLERPEDAPNRLRLTAPLQRVENGPCLGCAWQAPDYLDSPDNATLELDQANHAIFTLGGNTPQDMLPFVAGVSVGQWLPSYTEYSFPDLAGNWVVVMEIPQQDGSYLYHTRTGWIEPLDVALIMDRRVGWDLWQSDGSPINIYSEMSLVCMFNSESSDPENPHSSDVPDCWLDGPSGEFNGGSSIDYLYFPVPYANIGASRISAVHPETGVRLTMYRLEYD